MTGIVTSGVVSSGVAAHTPARHLRAGVAIGAGIHGVMIVGMVGVIATGSHAADIACALSFVGLAMVLAPFVRRSPVVGDHILDLWLMALIMLAMVMPAAPAQAADAAARHAHGGLGPGAAWIVIAGLAWVAARPLWARISGRTFTRWWWLSAATCATGVFVMLILCH